MTTSKRGHPTGLRQSQHVPAPRARQRASRRLVLVGAGALLASLSVSALPANRLGNPLVITKGGTYRGTWESLDQKIPAVLIQTREPVIIEDSVIRGRGHLIRGWHVNLTVRNTRGYALNPMADKAVPGRFLLVEEILNLHASNNFMDGTSGIYVHKFQGDPARGQTIKILRNQVRNVDGRTVTRAGVPSGASTAVQAVQLNAVRHVPGVEIAWNEVINEPGKSLVEENINIYGSIGTPGSPISIHHNFIQGAYPRNPARDKIYSGGGIMVGDGDQSSLERASGYVNVFQNHVVSTSNQGIAIAGGHHQRVYDNRVLSSGRLPDRSAIPSANVGVYMWDTQKGAQRTPMTFFSNSVTNNLIGWTRFSDTGQPLTNPTWLPSCHATTGNHCGGNRAWPTPVTVETERAEHGHWLAKVRANGVQIGPQSPRPQARRSTR